MIREKHIILLLCTLTILYVFSAVIPILGTFSPVYLVLIIAINNYYLLLCNVINTPHNRFIKIFTVFYLLNVIGYLLTAQHGSLGYFSMFKSVVLVSSAFFPFYYFGYRQYDLQKVFRIMLFASIPLAVMLFYREERENLLLKVTSNTDVINNTSYLFLFLTPFIFLVKNKILKNLIFLLMFTFVIEGAKRGALIIFVLILCYNIFDQIKALSKESAVNKLKYVVIYSAAIVVGYVYLLNKFTQNTFLISRLEGLDEGNVSGRDVIYESLINNWMNAENFHHLIIGFGFASSMRYSGTGNLAHNDWMELLTNFGLIGVFLYAAIILYIAKIGIKEKSPVIIASFLIMFSSALFSMFYTAFYSVFIMQLVGYFIAYNSFNKKDKIIY